MTILTPQRMMHLANNKKLSNVWYLIATVTLTVCNQPQEIPNVYHYALHLNDQNVIPSIELYDKISTVVKHYDEIKSSGSPKGKIFNPYPASNHQELNRISAKFRESILKTSALSGLPKAINSLTVLRDTTPQDLIATDVNRPAINNFDDYLKEQERGKLFWKRIHNKISGRVINSMSTSYPDLWQYTIQNVYSPLLSYCGILSEQETSLIVISCLIPQDVNPQLKGHLKGAKNIGVDMETIDECREMVIEISQWCGVSWKSEIAKL
ncbi:hypothetical protein CANARDRAFT_28460 [[Candida] arabinofermentans NRRL YB-2248]|uniref:Carboxymuconolactone decarboxylase-like domain-containing protein n=1 Tax=[Candida] arabinofermentans NRRL YB-2248 TaxID=983967 RepID=A0A1E4T083_9ASCO|nr:hypothetical protein CANARDRAFT_28460 [[Candida] arabinofermentans NRRL YB-2248]